MFTPINWKELEFLVQSLTPLVDDPKRVERVFVPARPQFKAGFLKSDWVISFGKKTGIWISLRPQNSWVSPCEPEDFKPSPEATRSPFDLALSKCIVGAKLIEATALPKERVALFWFMAKGNQKFGLLILLIPSKPEAILVDADFMILGRSRGNTDLKPEHFKLPSGKNKAPEAPPIRPEFKSHKALSDYFLKILKDQALTQKNAQFHHIFKERKQRLENQIKTSETQLRSAQGESPWQRWGDLLKANLNQVSESDRKFKVTDYETDEVLEIPHDPKLSIKAQLSKFYQLEKRKTTRIQEAKDRIQSAKKSLSTLKETLENELRIQSKPDTAHGKSKKDKPSQLWNGRTFVSKEGLKIRVGRNLKENLELTLKIARGNDVWLHVKGKPSAHGVVHLETKKSASLETLLDAANLVIHYSGGIGWGKTEVDYTHRKYVKRIKGTDQVRYTHNKTLMITPDSKRIEKLLSQT